MIPEHQFVFGQRGLHVALEPAMMLHAFCERVADEHHVVAFFEFQLGRIGRESRQCKDACDDDFFHKNRGRDICHIRRGPSSVLFTRNLQVVNAPVFSGALASLSDFYKLGFNTSEINLGQRLHPLALDQRRRP